MSEVEEQINTLSTEYKQSRKFPVDDTEEQKALREANCYNGIPSLKSAMLNMEITEEQERELERIASDVNYFAKNYFYINSNEYGTILFDMFPFQEKMLDIAYNNRFVISMLPRQSGKCVVGKTKIKLRNKTTGELVDMSIEELMKITEAKAGA